MFLYFVLVITGFLGGAVSIFALYEPRARRMKEEQARLAAAREELERSRQALDSKRAQIDKQTGEKSGELAVIRRQTEEKHQAQRALLDAEAADLERLRKEFSERAVTYTELQNENAMLKRDLRNIEIALRKLKLDRDTQQGKQKELDARSRDLASRYLKESAHWINAALDTDNYTASRQRLKEVIERCREIGFRISATEEEDLLEELKAGHERSLRIAREHEEHARLKGPSREGPSREGTSLDDQRPDRERELREAKL